MRSARTTYYLRVGEDLDAHDLGDLEKYFAHLRNYYGIPDDQPVFGVTPKRTDQPRELTEPDRPRRATGRNRDDHPWRNTL